jgi:hypothetical protein
VSARRYRFGPLERRGVVGALGPGQIAILATAAGLSLLAMYGVPNGAGMALALGIVLAAAAAIYLPLQGRTVAEWAPVVMGWVLGTAERQRGYRSSAPTGGALETGDGSTRPSGSLPPELGGLRMLEVPYGKEAVGVLHDRRAGTFTAALAVRAGVFGLLEGSEQERKLDGWGSVLASLARDGSPVRRLQWVERTLPAAGDELADHFQRERDRAVPLDGGLVGSYIELIESSAPVSQEHEILLALQVSERQGAREIRRLGGGTEAGCELCLREAEALAERLSVAEVSVFGMLRRRRYAAAIRDAYDPYGRHARRRAAIGDPQKGGVDPALMGPLAAESSWSEYRTDSAHHATFWISSWPKTDVGPAFLLPLLMQSSAVRSVSVCIEPVPHSTAMRRAEEARTAEVAEEMQRQRQGFLTGARLRQRQQAAVRREEELADGHAETRRAGFFTVSGRSAAELEQAVVDVEHAAALARLEVQRLYGEQAEGFTFTLPLARGLR